MVENFIVTYIYKDRIFEVAVNNSEWFGVVKDFFSNETIVKLDTHVIAIVKIVIQPLFHLTGISKNNL